MKPIVNWLVGLIDKYIVKIDSVTKIVKDCDIDIEVKK